MSYCVIGGGGKVGEAAARMLLDARHEVAVIDKSPERIDDLSKRLSGRYLSIVGDCCDTRTLKDAGIEHADVYCAMSGEDADNLASCEIATTLYKVGEVIARVNDPRNENIFRKMNIKVVNATRAVSNRVHDLLRDSLGDRPSIALSHNGYVLIEAQTASKAGRGAGEGRRVSDLGLPKSASLFAVWVEDRYQPVDDTTIVPVDTDVLVLTLPEDETATRAALFDL